MPKIANSRNVRKDFAIKPVKTVPSKAKLRVEPSHRKTDYSMHLRELNGMGNVAKKPNPMQVESLETMENQLRERKETSSPMRRQSSQRMQLQEAAKAGARSSLRKESLTKFNINNQEKIPTFGKSSKQLT